MRVTPAGVTLVVVGEPTLAVGLMDSRHDKTRQSASWTAGMTAPGS